MSVMYIFDILIENFQTTKNWNTIYTICCWQKFFCPFNFSLVYVKYIYLYIYNVTNI